jgi:porphobilinogen deaminase
LGGGCSSPISCLATVENSRLKIVGMISDREGLTVLKDRLEDGIDDPVSAGARLAQTMLKSGAAAILDG